MAEHARLIGGTTPPAPVPEPWRTGACTSPYRQHGWWKFARLLALAVGILALLAALCGAAVGILERRLLLRVCAELKARGLHVRASSERGRPRHYGLGNMRLVASWPSSPSGPMAQAALNRSARAALERAVAVRGARSPRGHCSKAAWLGPMHQGSSDTIGEGDVAVLTRGPRLALILPQSNWGKLVNVRSACTFGTCFHARRPACRLPGPLRVLWYARPPADAPLYAAAVGARSIAEVECLTTQCKWARRGLEPARPGGEPLAQLVSDPERACVFVATKVVLRDRDTSRCTKTRPCARSFGQALAHWSAAGRPGRNHLVILAQCVFRCDHPGEYRLFGSSGDAMLASASTWFGLFRPGFDFFLATRRTQAMEELARSEPAAGWWAEEEADAKGGGTVGGNRRPLLLTFRGSISGMNRWAETRLLAAEWAHDAGAGVFISVADKPSTAHCGTQTHANWTLEAIEAGSTPAAIAAVGLSYSSLLSSSTFGFTPGGSGPYSFRFTEVLASGSIPVVPEDLVMLWDGSVRRPIDWDACVVRVNRAEVRALGEVVRAVAPAGSAALRARRTACGRAWAELEGLRATDEQPGQRLAPERALPHLVSSRVAYECECTARIWLELRARIHGGDNATAEHEWAACRRATR